MTRKLVEKSRAVLNRRAATKCLPRDQSVINQPPLPVPIPPDRVRESDTPVHVPPFMSPNPALHKPKAMNEVDAEYDPLMDTDSPYDDALVEIEYRRPVDNDFTLPPSLEKQIDQGRLAKRDLPRQAEIDQDYASHQSQSVAQYSSPFDVTRFTGSISTKPTVQRYICLFITKQDAKVTQGCKTHSDCVPGLHAP